MLFQVYRQHGQSTRSINGPNNDNDLKSKASQIIDLSFWVVSNPGFPPPVFFPQILEPKFQEEVPRSSKIHFCCLVETCCEDLKKNQKVQTRIYSALPYLASASAKDDFFPLIIIVVMPLLQVVLEPATWMYQVAFKDSSFTASLSF